MDDCLSRAQLDGYLGDALSPDEMSALEAHIEGCRRCHDALVDLEIEEALPRDDAGAQVEPAAAAPERIIGPYRLISELGRGGQACVYLAEDTRLPRRVALKVFQSGLAASPSVLLRFQREAASLSRFDHPGICTVYETGEWRGISYIAMRLVDGETLARWITRRVKAKAGGEVPDRAALLEAIGLIERSARALHVAHEAGIVHRDIKPSNIMIAEGGEPVIVDFGLARDEESADPTLTRPGDVAGTPVYMSPEQIRGRRALVDRRSDVFSLGVMAYEALTLTLPFEAPTTPAVFQKILSGPIPDPARASPLISRDLRVILETALERDVARRYPTALAFAEDLRRFRNRETILAKPAGPALRLRRWTQRNPVLTTSLFVILLILAMALGISLNLLEKLRSKSQLNDASLVRENALRLALESSAVLKENPGQALLLAMESAERAPSAVANNSLLEALASSHEVVRFWGHSKEVNCAAFSPDGSRVVTGSNDMSARVWSVESGECIAVASGHRAGVAGVEFSPDGTRILTAAADSTARIWDARSGKELVRFSVEGSGVTDVHFSPDGSGVLTLGQGVARTWDAQTGQAIRVFSDLEAVRCVTFSPDGATIGTGSVLGVVLVADVSSGEPLVTMSKRDPENDVRIADIQWSEDGLELITGYLNGTAAIWDARSGRQVAVLKGHRGEVPSVALSARRGRAATGSADSTARIWDATTGKELFILRHQDPVSHIDISRDGNLLVTASRDRTARVWDMETGSLVALFKGHAAPILHAAFSRDGDSVVTSSLDRTARVWSLRAHQPLEPFPEALGSARLVALSPAGTLLAVVPAQGAPESSADLLKLGPGPRHAIRLAHEDRIHAVDFSRDERFVVTASSDTTAKLWSAESGELLHELRGHTSAVLGARFSADGGKIVTVSKNGSARVWSASAGSELFMVNAPRTFTITASFSPDGARILCGTSHARVMVADAETGTVLLSWMDDVELRGLRSAEWSPDSRLLITTTAATQARIWSAITGRPESALVLGTGASFAAFSPDGKWIGTVGDDGIVRIWNATTREVEMTLSRDGFLPRSISFLANRPSIDVFYQGVPERNSVGSALVIYPLDPLAEARALRRDRLTSAEREQFKVGSEAERAAHRDELRGGGPVAPPH